jgi:D-arabinono-1,4-lactone oxidase
MQPFTRRRKAPVFTDYYWRSLPMDNNADDESLGTEFTEIFVPLERTAEVMRLLKEHFDAGGYDATGFYAQELYAGYRSEFWMSPNYRQFTFRLDPFWYIDNDGDPSARDGFLAQFWELLRKHDIPFRLHWGKYLPNYDHAEWAAYYRTQYPRWDNFMEIRRQRDPKNIFLTDYWRQHLGIS